MLIQTHGRQCAQLCEVNDHQHSQLFVLDLTGDIQPLLVWLFLMDWYRVTFPILAPKAIQYKEGCMGLKTVAKFIYTQTHLSLIYYKYNIKITIKSHDYSFFQESKLLPCIPTRLAATRSPSMERSKHRAYTTCCTPCPCTSRQSWEWCKWASPTIVNKFGIDIPRFKPKSIMFLYWHQISIPFPRAICAFSCVTLRTWSRAAFFTCFCL